MGRIFLLENSLISAGTHHFDLVDCLATGALARGFSVQIAANKKFRPWEKSSTWQAVRPTFSQTVYQPYSALAGIRQMQRAKPIQPPPESHRLSLWQRWQTWHRSNREDIKVERHVASFSRECGELFRECPLAEGDQVILPTASDLELLGALRHLAESPESIAATWHFIFHFSVYSGRPESYPSQTKALAGLQRRIEKEVEQLPFHRLVFFATTSALVEQYSRLGIPGVKEFYYPAAKEFFDSERVPQRSPTSPPPLRFVVAGGVRREKGQAELLDQLRRHLQQQNEFAANIRWVFQAPHRSKWRRQKLTLPPELPLESVEIAPHPLPQADYVKLIKNADVGVLLYDRERYFARCAGVLGEFLAAGKPVIVSAGCWLGDQLDLFAQNHARRLLQNYPIINSIPATLMNWLPNNVPQGGGVWSYDGASHPFEATFALQPQTGGLVIEFAWHSPTVAGSHCQWEFLIDGKPVGLSRVIQYRSGDSQSFLFFRVPQGADRATLRLRNPYASGTQTVHKVQIFELGPDAATVPVSAAGIAVAHHEQIWLAANELAQHFGHYCESAERLGRDWRERCSPESALQRLLTAPPKRVLTAEAS